ncbi:hypothetical protein WA026_021945 [Henosepilachna vigintioctopunctata]|uniref:Uncharacterized protein n=1 Tax=Henosepilachna vigintioctopunctata TaxID=420089 RepID=A0AAW1VAP8_9CUCU
MNEKKTTATFFKTSHSSITTLKLFKTKDRVIETQNSSKFLGIYLDESMKWDAHITQLCTNLSSVCFSLKEMEKYFNWSTLKVVYLAVFESRLRYASMFFGNSSFMKNVNVLQKRALRIILRLKYDASCRGKFREMSILTATAIHIQESLLFVFKNYQQFEQNTTSAYNIRTTFLKYPKHRLTHTEKGPEYSCVRYYNALPLSIRSQRNLSKYKSSVFKLLVHNEPYNIGEFFDYCRVLVREKTIHI